MQNTEQNSYKRSLGEERFGELTSINDLLEKEYNGEDLTRNEREALQNFNRFVVGELNKARTDHEFREKHHRHEVMATVVDHTEFLKNKYATSSARAHRNFPVFLHLKEMMRSISEGLRMLRPMLNRTYWF